MNLVGFEHIFTRNQLLDVSASARIAVADLDVIALLKMISFLDRPAEREHDLQDLALIIEEIVADDDARRWEPAITDRQVPYEDVGAFVLGSALRTFATERDREAIRAFVRRIHHDGRAAARFAHLAPPSWRRSDEIVRRRLDALLAGLGQ